MKISQEQFNALVYYAVQAHAAAVHGDRKGTLATYRMCADRFKAISSGGSLFGAEDSDARIPLCQDRCRL